MLNIRHLYQMILILFVVYFDSKQTQLGLPSKFDTDSWQLETINLCKFHLALLKIIFNLFWYYRL